MASTSLIKPVQLTWMESRQRVRTLQENPGIAGESWISYPPICGTSVHGRLTHIPAGHNTAKLTTRADLMILGVRGEVEIVIGETTYWLKPLDMMMVPLGTTWRCENTELKAALIHETYGCGSDTYDDAPSKGEGHVTFHDWRTYRREFKWSLPWSETWGYRRGSGPYFGSAGLRGHTVRQPPGQATPWHYAPRDLLFMPVFGEIEFRCAGKSFFLTPYDQLIIPAGVPYQYVNGGLEETVFLSTGGGLPPGGKGRYFSADPGWPIRDDAPIMDTLIDPYGNAKVDAV